MQPTNRPRAPWIPALALAAGVAGCGGAEPRFGSLTADARRFHVSNDIRVVALTNGLTVVLAPDVRTNLVSVDVRFLVGSADDPAGRAGLAHLVQHLAFAFPSGTSGATVWDKLSATALDQNGYTRKDVTHFTALALAPRVDALIELEAQRLEGRCEELDDTTFARARDAVLAEEAARRSPVADVIAEIDAAVWGADHPYRRPGGTGEIAAATRDEACAFFRAHYTPDRAVLVVTGNFQAEAVRQRIGERFSRITGTAASAPVAVPPPRLDGGRSEHEADVDHATALVYLPAPSWGAPGDAVHDMLLRAFDRALAELDAEHAWIVRATVGYGESGGGRRRTTVIALEVDDPTRLDAAVDAALARGHDLFLDADRDQVHDDYDDEDDRVVVRDIGALRGWLQTRTITRLDRIAGRGSWLADFVTYAGHSDFMLAAIHESNAVGGDALVHEAQALFDRARAHVALVRPRGDGRFPARALVAAAVPADDLAPWHTTIDPAEATRPLPVPRDLRRLAVDDYRLPNGLRVLLYLDALSPTVDARLVYPVGTTDDGPGQPGVAAAAVHQLAPAFEQIRTERAFYYVRWASGIGNQLSRRIDARTTTFHSHGIAAFGDWHVWWLSWLLDQGLYPPAPVAAAGTPPRRTAAPPDDADPAASRWAQAFRARLYGADHPLAAAPATAAARAAIEPVALEAWRRGHFAAEDATLIVTGGFKRATMRRTIDELFGPWPARAPAASAPPARRAVPPPAPAPGWLGVRAPAAMAVTVRVGFTAGSDAGRDRAARLVLIELLDLRLRQLRGDAGAHDELRVDYGDDGGLALALETALDPSRAPDDAAALVAALAAIRADAAGLAVDFARARRRVFARLLADRTDATDVADGLQWMLDHQLPLAQLDGLAAAVARLTPAQVAAVATADLDPARRVIAVRGRAAAAAATLDRLGAADVTWFDE